MKAGTAPGCSSWSKKIRPLLRSVADTSLPYRFRDAALRLLLRLLFPPLRLAFGNLSLKATRRWANAFRLLSWPLLCRKRRIAAANLAIAFPELTPAERAVLLRRNQTFLFELGLDWLHFFFHPEDITRRMAVSPQMKQLMRERQRSCDGTAESALFCTPHLGNWELESRVSAITGRPGAVVTATFSTPCLNELAARFRTDNDDTLLIPADGAARGVLRALNEQRDIGILIDQNIAPRHGGIFVPFFGLPAATSRLPASITRRRRIPLYVVGCIKQEDGSYCVIPQPLPKAPWEYSDDSELTAAILQAFEELIRKAPEQYLWLYTRWRYIPGNTPPEALGAFPAYAHRTRAEAPPQTLAAIRPQ